VRRLVVLHAAQLLTRPRIVALEGGVPWRRLRKTAAHAAMLIPIVRSRPAQVVGRDFLVSGDRRVNPPVGAMHRETEAAPASARGR